MFALLRRRAPQRTSHLSRRGYVYFLLVVWLYTAAWASAIVVMLAADWKSSTKFIAGLVLSLACPSLNELFTSYAAYLRDYERSVASSKRDA